MFLLWCLSEHFLKNFSEVYKLVLMFLGSLNVGGPSAPGSSGSSSSRIKPVGPKSTRYINFLACGGYVVEILGGKHFKTPEGEFVEMKSGTQYKIHVKNTHTYGKKGHMCLHYFINQCKICLFKVMRL